MAELNLTLESSGAHPPRAAFIAELAARGAPLLADGDAQNRARHGVPGRQHRQGLKPCPSVSSATHWLSAMLDEIDYGMLLLSDGWQVLHVNHTARADLDAGHPLQLLGRELRARHAQDVARLHDALAAARRGLRRMVTLGECDTHPLSVAVVPLGALGAAPMQDNGPGGGAADQAILLVMGKRRVCESLTVQWFARSHGLTPAETKVLEALCRGDKANGIATAHGVELSTVRTQIGAIRAKTGVEGIQDLVRRIAVLPPILSRLRLAA